jgi:hypothetical protein
MTEVVILAVDDTERDFATRAFGVPAFTAVTSTMKGAHVVVIDGPGASLRSPARACRKSVVLPMGGAMHAVWRSE